MLWRFLIVAALALFAAGAAACGDDDEDVGDDSGAETTAPAVEETDPPGETGAPTDEPADTADETDEPGDGEEVLVPLIAEGFAFDATTISAEPGETVTVTYTNNDSVSHTFTIDELDVNLVLSGGASEAVTFTMPEGELRYYCQFHPSSMEGTLQPGSGSAQSGGGDDSRADTRY